MISLAFFKQEDFSELNYTLDEEQSKYTATAADALQRMHERNDSKAFAVTILEDTKPVGFFVLDFGDDKLELTENKNAVLVRSLSVNPVMQGKGAGKMAMQILDDFVKKNFKDCDEIVLAVNQKNIPAYHIYLKTGYIYDGKNRIGRSGPQYLMYKKL